MTIKRALISVYNKDKIIEVAQFLAQNNVEIISTGKTHKILSEVGIKTIEVSNYTKSPKIMDGRVKTLHPKIHGGILGIREKHNFDDAPQIDLVITNLYPFTEFANNEDYSEEEIIEQIDIGGVTLIRAAAKNFQHVCVITDIADYKLLKSINIGPDDRRKLATKAFASVARYDNAIYEWISKSSGDQIFFGEEKIKSFRYGENPHQTASFYSNNIENFPKQLQGKELSYNNIIDSAAAYKLVFEFDEPTVAIIKHNNPCGVASDNNIEQAYKKAFDCDHTSSFGGIVATNREITQELANSIIKVFTEVVICPSIDQKAIDVFAQKPNIRVLINKNKICNRYDVKTVFGGFIVQSENNSIINKDKTVTNKKPNNIKDLHFAWKVCKHVKSNAIVICKNNATVGIGAGQMSRIDSMKIAIDKSRKNDLKNAVIASDAFFPFDDCIKLAAKVGISAIIQPGGSVRDQEIIDAANKSGIAMIFTGMRHFRH
ncbi:MAG: bifunctional phosphoribosylaminoimidazolecarboxamide formyltransferase/IMP cyclohydrolase [Rickettsiaceae bacterium H1]|nr:bifunctional phosphoribosylaminoimidazolecarboxamide formyltransferase/IMP cyclohydrolase [Rickettsiaceae bacterium H1]